MSSQISYHYQPSVVINHHRPKSVNDIQEILRRYRIKKIEVETLKIALDDKEAELIKLGSESARAYSSLSFVEEQLNNLKIKHQQALQLICQQNAKIAKLEKQNK